MIVWLPATAFDALAAPIFAVLLDTTAKGTVLLALAATVAALMRRRSAAARHMVWVSTLVCMVALPVLSAVLPSAAVLPGWLDLTRFELSGANVRAAGRRPAPTANLALQAAPTARNASFGDLSAMRETTRASTAPTSVEASPQFASRDTQSHTATARNHDPISPFARSIAIVWLVGCLLCLARLALSAAYLRWLCRHNQVVQHGALFGEFEASRLALGCARPVRLLVRSDSTLPLAWGVVRPIVLLPADARDWPAAQRHAVLLHELAHIVRRDPLWRLLAELSRAVYWFHPLVWLAAWRAHVESERATDDAVLLQEVAASSYARILLDVVSRGRVRRLGLALGVAMASTRTLESRLRSIMDPTKDRRAITNKAVLATIVACLLVAVPLATLRTADAQVDPASKNASAGDEQQKYLSRTPPTTVGEAALPQTAQDTTQRVRELIYIFRHMRVFDRIDEWASAIRELVQIGKPAVPELVAELNRTDRDETLRSLGFTLRAIKDPRAVPALIGAIPKTLVPPRSSYNLGVLDPDLLKFMAEHDRSLTNQEGFLFGRPLHEISEALSTITGHQEPREGEHDTIRSRALRGTAERRAATMAEFRERQNLWAAWWSNHWQEFVTREELQSVELPATYPDLVEEAGVARFGPLFPTGADIHLGPIHEVELSTRDFADAPHYLDLDTGTAFQPLEGLNLREIGGDQGLAEQHWRNARGVDLRGQFDGALDLHLWLIDNARWDTLEREIHSGGTLDLGREAHYLAPFDNDSTDFHSDKVGTFLFTTREGGRGVLQCFPPSGDRSIMRVRYRLWNEKRDAAERQSERVAARDASRWEPVVTVTLPTPGRGKAFLLDLESGETVAPPDSTIPDDSGSSVSLSANDELATWGRELGVDIAATQTTVEHEMRLAPSNESAKTVMRARVMQLIGLDMDEVRISSASFETLSAETVIEILRTPNSTSIGLENPQEMRLWRRLS